MLQHTQTDNSQNTKLYEYINEVSKDIDTVVMRLNTALENETSTVDEEIKSDTSSIIERIFNKIKPSNPQLIDQFILEIRRDTCIINSQFETFLYHLILMLMDTLNTKIIFGSSSENGELFYYFKAEDIHLISTYFNKKQNTELLDSFSKQNLNLTICRQITELMNLEIHVDSKSHLLKVKIPD